LSNTALTDEETP